jgi:outer membrane protein insertion porin family
MTFPGGDTSGVFNAEYRIPIVGPVSASLFSDIGASGILRKNQLQLDPDGYTNLTAQFPGTSISSTLPIQSGTDFRLRSSVGVEFVVQLPIVNAPFRLYYAYNPLRVSRQIIAPSSQFNVDAIRTQVTSEVFESVIQPQLKNVQLNPQRINFFESKTTFRFTVSRTF